MNMKEHQELNLISKKHRESGKEQILMFKLKRKSKFFVSGSMGQAETNLIGIRKKRK